MDVLLSRVTQQAVQYAIRSGISITTGYAIRECGRLLSQAPRGREHQELMRLQMRLESKICVISPSIDMIELIAARGNTSLDSAISITKEIRYDIQKLGNRLQTAANKEQRRRHSSSSAKGREQTDNELKAIIGDMKLLLARIEDAVPLINLAITTSGINLTTKLSGSISPSRLLQASTFLTAADKPFTADPMQRQQVGPAYTVTLYMLFAGHASRAADPEGIRQTTWKEVLHKARLKLWRLPLDELYALPGEAVEVDIAATTDSIPGDTRALEFAYQLTIVENLDDGRHHEQEDGHRFDDVPSAGVRDVIPIHEVSKIFYADTGKILNIGNDSDSNNPVLLIKRDVHAEPPRRMLQRAHSRTSWRNELSTESPVADQSEPDHQSEIDAQIERESVPPEPRSDSKVRGNSNGNSSSSNSATRLAADLDPEWMAFEVFTEDAEGDSGSDSEQSEEPNWASSENGDLLEPGLISSLTHLNLRATPTPSSDVADGRSSLVSAPASSLLQFSPDKRRAELPVRTSLSLLEMLIKLTALQQFRQESHLAIEDEFLNFFLEDSATAGAGSDKEYRQRLRHDATRRVGFDPYDESPIKRRSEEYIRNARARAHTGASQQGSPSVHRDGGFEDLERSFPIPDLTNSSTYTALQRPPTLTPSPLRRFPFHYQTRSQSSTPDLNSNKVCPAALRGSYRYSSSTD